MNFNEILNSTISGLLCTITVALSSALLKFLKKCHNKDKIMFWFNFSFYYDIFAIVFSAIVFRIDKCSLYPFSFGDTKNLFFFIALIINVIFTIIQYNNIKKYIKTTN